MDRNSAQMVRSMGSVYSRRGPSYAMCIGHFPCMTGCTNDAKYGVRLQQAGSVLCHVYRPFSLYDWLLVKHQSEYQFIDM